MNELLADESTYAWIRTARKALDLTQEALADLVQCSVDMISKIEQGQKTPSPNLERRLRQHLSSAHSTPTTQAQNQPFGLWLTARRNTLDLSREMLADIVGCAPDTLRKIEKGTLRPSANLISLLAAPLLVPEVNKLRFSGWARGVRTGSEGPPPALLVGTVQKQSNLPIVATSFVGRDVERMALIALLRRRDVRLVTLTGPGGVGKTRVAQEIGADLQPEFEDNVWFVDLAPTRTRDQLIQTLIENLQIKEVVGEKQLDTLRQALRTRQVLLLLDNFEQLVGAESVVADLLGAAPRLKVLVTSRTALHIRGEHEFPIEPLNVNGIYPDGIWFVQMPQPLDVTSVLVYLHRTLYVPESTGQDKTTNLVQYLHERRLLLVFEQPTTNDTLDPPVRVQDLFRTLQRDAPGLHILVTDHRSLWSPGSDTPLTEEETDLIAVADTPAVALFFQRAQAVRLSMVLSRRTILAAAAICGRLDGLPLAIELAASRSKHFAPAVLLGRLEQRLKTLTDGAVDLPDRQRTLRALLDWSYDLLNSHQQRLFVRCAVFVGGWSVAAAEAVCAKTRNEQNAVLIDLLQLSSQNLIIMNTTDDTTPRFTMLETIREYAQERLIVRGNADIMEEHHTRYFCEMAQQWAPQVYEAAQLTLKLVSQDYPNLQKAMQSADTRGAWEIAAQLAVALLGFWEVRGYWTEGRYWLERLQPHSHMLTTKLQADVLEAAGVLTFHQGELPHAQSLFEASLALYRKAEDALHIAAVNNRLSVIARRGGHSIEAQTLLNESMDLYTQLQDQHGRAETLYLLGTVARTEEHLQQARTLYEQSLELFRSLNHAEGVARLLFSAGTMVRQMEGPTQSLPLLEESLTHYQDINHKDGIAKALTELGEAYRSLEQYDQALKFYSESTAIRKKLGARWGQALYLLNRGILAADQEQFAAAIEFYQDSLTLFREGGQSLFALHALLSLGHTTLLQGNLAAARTFFQDSRTMAKPGSSEMAWAEWGLGRIMYQEGARQEARRLYRASLRIYHNLDADTDIARVMVTWLEMLIEEDWAKAAQLYGPLHQFISRLGYRYDPADRRRWQQITTQWAAANIETARVTTLDWTHTIAEVLNEDEVR